MDKTANDTIGDLDTPSASIKPSGSVFAGSMISLWFDLDPISDPISSLSTTITSLGDKKDKKVQDDSRKGSKAGKAPEKENNHSFFHTKLPTCCSSSKSPAKDKWTNTGDLHGVSKGLF